jgi:hypothetical protein
MSQQPIKDGIADQYQGWDRKRVLDFILANACPRLEMLRAIEEERHLPLPATIEQQKVLLQLASELKGDDSAARQHCSSSVCNSPTEAVTDDKVDPALDAFNKLDPTDRAVVRDASKTLFSLNNVLAEGLIEYKQSDLGKKDQSQEQAPADKGEEIDL